MLIILITFLTYSNIFQNEFIWDDPIFIVNWPTIRSFENIPELIEGDLPKGHQGGYRPIRGIFQTVSYHFFGTNPVGYHFQSIMIHLICTIIVYLIVLQMTDNSIIAFLTSLLFGVHPVHTEAITFITASFDSIGIIFFFAAFYLYIKKGKKKKNRRSKLLYLLSILLAGIAFFTYEVTLTLPVLLVLHDLIYKRIYPANLKEKLFGYLPYMIVAGIYLFIRFFALKIVSRSGYFAHSLYLTFLTMTKVFTKYLLISILPLNLSVNHIIPTNIISGHLSENMSSVFLSQSLFDLPIIASAIIIIAVVCVAVKQIRTRPIILFTIGWFFIALLPVSNLFFPHGTIMAERYLYISSFAACFLISNLIYKFYHYKSSRYLKLIAISLFVSLLLFYSCQTHERNRDWENSLSLWSKTVQQTPFSVSANHNLGEAYYHLAKPEEAIQYLQKAISIKPSYSKASPLLAASYIDLNELQKARETLEKTLKKDPNSDLAIFFLGYVYELTGEYDNAVSTYKKAIDQEDSIAYYHLSLAYVYHLQGKRNLASASVQEAVSLDPLLETMLIQSAVKHKRRGQYMVAKSYYSRALVAKKYKREDITEDKNPR